MWFFTYFPELSDGEPTSYKTLGLHVAHSLHTIPSDNLMSFFLGLLDWALVHLYLRPDLLDFECPLASASTACRVLISRGCFAFSSSMFASPTSLQPYLHCLWARQFGVQWFIQALPPLPYNQLDLEFAHALVKEYRTLSC